MRPVVQPIILSGGVGARLWPLSRQLRPKQLLPLHGDTSMLRQTIKRLSDLGLPPPAILCNVNHRFIIAEQVREIGLTDAKIVLEPHARNTAPAATVAALMVQRENPEGIVLLLPADHVIGDAPALQGLFDTAIEAARQGAIVTFGIRPSRAETGYGYIRIGAAHDGLAGCYKIERFVEKPDAATAAAYLASGDYLWNSGMFAFRAETFVAEVARLKPDMLAVCREALDKAVNDLDFVRLGVGPFARAEAISIDCAIMEHTDKAVVVDTDVAWSDVGSWQALWEIGSQDAKGNVRVGDTVAIDANNCYLRGEGVLLAALGVEDMVIVATEDAVLVAPRARAQEVNALVREVEASGRGEHHAHRQVYRPWGWYRMLHNGDRFQVKEIMVKPEHRLSRQMHHHRAEHWVVVRGTAKVIRGNETFYITEDQSTYIPHNTPHGLENPGRIPLHMIEVQSGPYLQEDDIVRFEDPYGRPPLE